MSMAITVVLPEPVANLKAMRKISGFACSLDSFRRFNIASVLFPILGATSDNHIAVSTASI